MSKTYRLRYDLLMPGRIAIILPTGYKVELKDDLYHGEGGWFFAPHGVEDNKYHWEEVKEENKSNDSFQWTDELAEEYAKWWMNKEHRGWGNLNSFKKLYQSKPQAENKPDRDWRILQFINKKGDHTWDYDGLNNDYVGSRHGARFPEQSLLDSRDGRGSVANGDVFINKVFRKSDGEVFSVGDEVVHKTDGLINTAKILKFVIPEVIKNKMWFEFEDGATYVKDLANFNRIPPQPQKEEQIVWEEKLFYLGKEVIPIDKVDELCERAIGGAIRILEEEMSDTGNLDHAMFAFNLRKKLSDYKNSKQ